MKMNTFKSISNLLLAVIVLAFTFTACNEDDFTEEDLLNLQIESQDESEKEYVTYTVTVFSASVTQSANRTSESQVASGATVVLTQNDSSTTFTTDANGRVVIPEVRTGSVSLAVSATDHTTCYVTAELYSNGDGTNASTSVYLFPTTVEAGAATVTGVAYAETDFTNDAPEFAEGATLNAYIDVNDGEFINAYWSDAQSNGDIQEINYVSSVSSATVGADGTFSIVVPTGYATEDGLPIVVEFDEFAANQTIVYDGAVSTFSGIFGNGSLSSVPTDAGVTVVPDATSTAGSGVDFTFEPQGDGLDAANDIYVTNGGSGYVTASTYVGDTTYTVTATDTPDTTDTGFVQAAIDITVNSSGNIVSATVSSLGAGYLTAPSFTPSNGSGFEYVLEFDQDYKAILADGGTGYLFYPSIKYSVQRYDQAFQTLSEIEEVDLSSYSFELLNGTVVLPNPTTAYVGTFTLTELVSAPTMVAELPFERIEAEFSPIINADGVITGVTIVDGGQGYDYTSLPGLTTTAIVGAGAGANIIVDAVSQADGSITAVQIINGGADYQPFGNTPTSASSAGSNIFLTAAPGETYYRDYDYGTGFRRDQ